MTTFTVGATTLVGASGGAPLDDEKPLVLLVHGAGMDRTVWSLQTRWLAHHGHSALASTCRAMASTRSGPRLDRGLRNLLSDVVSSADRPVHLVGHSMGTLSSHSKRPAAPRSPR